MPKIEKFICDVKLSITNGPLYDYVMSQVSQANVPMIFKLRTFNCGKIIHRQDNVNAGILCTHTTISYTIEMDMYNIVKKKTNRIISQIIKRFPRIRRKLIMKEIRNEMKSNFEKKIKEAGGIFAGAAATVISVNVYPHY